MLPSHELLGEETPLLPQHSTLQKLANGILGVIFFFLFLFPRLIHFIVSCNKFLGGIWIGDDKELMNQDENNKLE
jgi:hypothetical protein